MVGELQVSLETDVVSVTTYYQRLINHCFGELLAAILCTMCIPIQAQNFDVSFECSARKAIRNNMYN